MLFVLTDCFVAVAFHCVADCDGVLLFIFCYGGMSVVHLVQNVGGSSLFIS